MYFLILLLYRYARLARGDRGPIPTQGRIVHSILTICLCPCPCMSLDLLASSSLIRAHHSSAHRSMQLLVTSRIISCMEQGPFALSGILSFSGSIGPHKTGLRYQPRTFSIGLVNVERLLMTSAGSRRCQLANVFFELAPTVQAKTPSRGSDVSRSALNISRKY